MSALAQRVARLEEKTEVEFIRREARLIPSVLNFWQHFRLGGERSEPRSRAALSSVLWRLFSPGAAAAVGGGALLLMQTWLLLQQNDKLDQQTHVMQSQANVTVATQIAPLLEQVTEFTDNQACFDPAVDLRMDSKDLEKNDGPLNEEENRPLPRCWIDVPSDRRWQWTRRCFELVARDGCFARDLIAKAYEATGDREHPGKLHSLAWQLPLPSKIQLQVATLASMSRPYRFIETAHTLVIGNPSAPIIERQAPALVARPLSPERGLLLVSLLSRGLAIHGETLSAGDFTSAYAYRARLDGASIDRLDYVSFPLASAREVRGRGTWVRSDFRCADFQLADLSQIDVHGGDYSGARFTFAELPAAVQFDPSQLCATDFHNAQAPNKEFLDELAAKKLPGFNRELWIMDEGLVIQLREHAKLPSVAC